VAKIGRKAGKAALPAQIRSALSLVPGERVLAASALVDRSWVVGTTLALHVVGRSGAAGSAETVETSRDGWDQVAAAVWSDTASMLQVTWVDHRRDLLLELAGDAGYLPEVIRERVEASVVLSRRFDVNGRRGVRVAVRRAAPGSDLSTQVVADRGVDLADPAVAARVEAELADLREQTGMRD
jgi:hypothetical protein